MTLSYQQGLLADYLWRLIRHDASTTYATQRELEEDVTVAVKALRPGQHVVLDFSNEPRLRVVSGLDELSTVSRGARVISFEQLERCWHEQCAIS